MRHFGFVLLATLSSLASAQQRELTPDEQVAHVLSRLTFGARPGDAERVREMGVDAWILEQLRPAKINDGAARVALASLDAWTLPLDSLAQGGRRYVISDVAPRRPPMQDTALAGMIRDGSIREMSIRYTVALRADFSFAAGKISLAQTSERQLLEVVSDFWENHFSIYAAKQPSREALVGVYRDALRPRVFSTFRDLLGAVARSPAMLYYLDNHLSAKSGLNENYARELLELHTLGADGGYTQDDVINVARALTGWGLDQPNPGAQANRQTRFEFHADRHDMESKVVLGHTLAAGRGIEDGEDVLDILASHPSTARFISWKLSKRFVGDEPPAALVDRVAETFLRTDGNIAAVVHAIVTSDEFFARAAFRAKVKSPFEFVISARRALGADPDSSRGLVTLLAGMGQPTFGHADPNGWPDDAASWMNSGTMLSRVLIAENMTTGKAPFGLLERWKPWDQLRKATADEQADGVIAHILGGAASPATRQALRSVPDDGADRLRQMVALALGSPEFQRR